MHESQKTPNFALAKREQRVPEQNQSDRNADIKIALWCNGSTQVSGTFSEGSNPSKATPPSPRKSQVFNQLGSFTFCMLFSFHIHNAR